MLAALKITIIAFVAVLFVATAGCDGCRKELNPQTFPNDIWFP
jgi:hypothetical protein